MVSLSNTISIGSSDKVNRWMKTTLQNFGSILSIWFLTLFVIWLWIWQDFVIVWRNTPCAVFRPAVDSFPHWCWWTVLPDVVMQHNFSQIWCHFTCLHGWAREGIFPGVATSVFLQKFFCGRPKVVKFSFYRSKLRKQHFLLKFSNFCPSSDTRMLVYRKSSCHTTKKSPF